jgi:NAD(P)-dependent dehydrogenase (short-subunit alcohol dehydrogenase family)
MMRRLEGKAAVITGGNSGIGLATAKSPSTALPLLSDGASIILNTSVVDNRGTPGTSPYAATKAALQSLANRGRRTSRTGHTRQYGCSRAHRYPDLGGDGAGKGTVDEWRKQIATEVSMKRFGQPEKVAATVAFLAALVSEGKM